MSKVFVIDLEKKPLNPIHPARARQLLRNGKAAVFRRFPFTLILKESRALPPVSHLRLKFDPGATTTGIALVNDSTGEIVFAAELKHRGFAIRDALTSRRQLRRSRRNRKTRYRKPRFFNRTKPTGCTGHGTRQSCRTDKYGFPNRYVPRFKSVKGFQTGDIVKAIVTKGHSFPGF